MLPYVNFLRYHVSDKIQDSNYRNTNSAAVLWPNKEYAYAIDGTQQTKMGSCHWRLCSSSQSLLIRLYIQPHNMDVYPHDQICGWHT